MIKKSLIVLSASFCLAGCGSYTISINKDDGENQAAANETTTTTETNSTDSQSNKSAATNTSQAVSTQASAKTQTDHSGTFVFVTADAKIRQNPDINSSALKVSKNGDVFEYLHEKVNTPDGRTWLKVHFGSSNIGYISQKNAGITDDYPSYARILENGTNIRSSASLNGNDIAKANIGDTVTFNGDIQPTSDGRIWLGVTLADGTTGYVSQKVATLTNNAGNLVYATNTADYDTVVITESKANVRYTPDKSSDEYIIEKAYKGDVYEYTGKNVYAQGRMWYEIYSYSGQRGYISSNVSTLQ